jgi:hypothetical protein
MQPYYDFSEEIPSERLVALIRDISSRWFLAHEFFCPEDGGDTFLRNVELHNIYTVPHPKRRHSS